MRGPLPPRIATRVSTRVTAAWVPRRLRRANGLSKEASAKRDRGGSFRPGSNTFPQTQGKPHWQMCRDAPRTGSIRWSRTAV